MLDDQCPSCENTGRTAIIIQQLPVVGTGERGAPGDGGCTERGMMRVPDYIGGYVNFLDQIRYMWMDDRERLIFRIYWLLKLRRSKLIMRQSEEGGD